MNREYSMIYIGYLVGFYYNDPILLCVSNDKAKVKYYLQKIRKLNKSNYDIREVVLDLSSAYNLYGDYMLEDFTKKYPYITNRDIEYVNDEITTTIEKFDEIYTSIKFYKDFISDIPKFKKSIDSFNIIIKIMENQLSKVKSLRKIGKAVIRKSVIFSDNIMEYLTHMGYLQESKELTELFYRKVNDDK